MTAPTIEFSVDPERCVRCGRCALDCVADAIDMTEAGPVLARPEHCIGCQHCLAVCPTRALSIFGKNPDDSVEIHGLPDPESVKRLIYARRSYRHFEAGDVPEDVFRDLLETAWLAPTGVNMQGVHFGALTTRRAMDEFRRKIYAGLERELARPGREAGPYDDDIREFIADWKERGVDNVFRGAPHLVIASTSPETICVEADPMAALSYLDLYAQSRGVGTVWCGFAMLAIASAGDSSLWREAGVPEGYRPGYAMLLGLPAFDYPRAVQRGPAGVTMIR